MEVRSTPFVGNSPERVSRYLDSTIKAVGIFEAGLEELKPFVDSKEERATYQRLTEGWADFKQFGGHVIGLAKKDDETSRLELAKQVRDVCPEKASVVEQALLDLMHFQVAEASTQSADSDQFVDRLIGSMAIIGSLAIAMILFVSFILANRLAATLGMATRAVTGGTQSIHSTAKQIGQVSERVMGAMETNLSVVSNTTETLAQISAAANKMAQQVADVESCTVESRSNAEAGKLVIDRLTGAMEKLRQSSEGSVENLRESNDRVHKVVQVIEEVASKTRIINEIVFQTKLLSFNASVEAARAGDHGKGFSVVAEEIGNLASMSGEAAQQINSLLDASMVQVSQTLEQNRNQLDKMAKELTSLVREGVEVTRESERALSSILSASHDVSKMIAEISAESQSSAVRVSQIHQHIEKINESCQMVADIAQKIEESSHVLTEEVEKLEPVTEKLSQTVGTKASLAA